MKEFSVTDLGEAAMLVYLGFNPVRLDRSDRGNYRIFIFDKDDAMPQHLSLYRSHAQIVDPYKYYKITRELKTQIAVSIRGEAQTTTA